MTKEQKKQLFGFGLPIILGTILLLGASYAWLQLTLEGTQTNIIKVGDLTLELIDQESVGIEEDGIIPMLDEVGVLQDPYHFTLKNNGTLASKYTIYLDNVDLESEEEQLPDEAIKFDLKKGNTTLIRTLLSYITGEDDERVLDTGVIEGGESFEYDLRMWIDEAATQEMAAGKTFRGKIRVVADQITYPSPTPEECFDFDIATGTINKYLCGPTLGFVVSGPVNNTIEDSPAGRFITDVVIPEKIKNTAVKAIKGAAAPHGYGFFMTGITSVVIPEGVTDIGQWAFQNSNLKSIVIPSTVKTIDTGAFADAKISSVVIPASVEELGFQAFRTNTLVSVTIKGKSSVSDFKNYSAVSEIGSPFISHYLTTHSGWLEGSACKAHAIEQLNDDYSGDNTNPCIHWEP